MLKLIESNEFSLYKMIINDANSQQIKPALIKYGNNICKALYRKNERTLFAETLHCINNGDKFLSNLDNIVHTYLENTISDRKTISPNKVFDLYTTGEIDKLLEYIEPVFHTELQPSLTWYRYASTKQFTQDARRKISISRNK